MYKISKLIERQIKYNELRIRKIEIFIQKSNREDVKYTPQEEQELKNIQYEMDKLLDEVV